MREYAARLVALRTRLAHALAGVFIQLSACWMNVKTPTTLATPAETANQAFWVILDVPPTRMFVGTIDAFATPSETALLATRALCLTHLQTELVSKTWRQTRRRLRRCECLCLSLSWEERRHCAILLPDHELHRPTRRHPWRWHWHACRRDATGARRRCSWRRRRRDAEGRSSGRQAGSHGHTWRWPWHPGWRRGWRWWLRGSWHKATCRWLNTMCSHNLEKPCRKNLRLWRPWGRRRR